jgi:putative membrane protein
MLLVSRVGTLQVSGVVRHSSPPRRPVRDARVLHFDGPTVCRTVARHGPGGVTILALERFFSAADHSAIEAAVREVEAQSASEIVPYAVERSDSYTRALWTAATLGALAAAMVAAFVRWSGEIWGGPVALWIALPPAAGGALAWLATLAMPALRRSLVPPDVLAERVRQRAMEAFVNEEVFRTRDRTGILIFVSLFERRVVVLADRGLDGRVTPQEWEDIVAGIVAGMRRRQPGPALAEGIRRCARLAGRLPPRPDDRDELPGQLRLGHE